MPEGMPFRRCFVAQTGQAYLRRMPRTLPWMLTLAAGA